MLATFARKYLVPASSLVVMVFVMTLLPAQQAAAAHDDCEVSVRGPFFYAGLVFPSTEISCDTVKQSIRLEATLDMDGTEVAAAERTCRKASRCRLGLASDGIFAEDIPGDQLWCGSATGSVKSKGPWHDLDTARSCETEDF